MYLKEFINFVKYIFSRILIFIFVALCIKQMLSVSGVI
ncbi:hypothetical protein PROCH_1422 [Prochlorococcus marinus str. EQPAC1]|nr:hypothetical protein PROCH_1422 [Prochlorococcus marinus str. EQPAC1]